MEKLINIITAKLRDPFTYLTLVSFLVSIFVLIEKETISPIYKALLTALVLIFIGLITIRFYYWYSTKSRYKFYANWINFPKPLTVHATLEFLSKNKAELEIISRSSMQWLIGQETDWNNKSSEYETKKKNLQDLIIQAIKAESKITFILQRPSIRVDQFSNADQKRLESQINDSIDSFNHIYNSLDEQEQSRLNLYISQDVIENSMIRLIKGNKLLRFIYEMSIGFRTRQSYLFSKPFVVFYGEVDGVKEFLKKFDVIKNNCLSRMDYYRSLGHKEVNILLERFNQYSVQRNNSNKYLVKSFAQHFLALIKKNNAEIENSDLTKKQDFIPPISVQILITNQCSTFCKMCDHYKLYNESLPEFSLNDYKNIVNILVALKIKNIILSGGEPLTRSDFFEILEISKSNQLNVGLLTNGLKMKGEPLTLNEALIISNCTSWVQFSIDSFDGTTFKEIRGVNYLDNAIESLIMLTLTQCPQLEIAFTIQKDNISEISKIEINFENKINECISKKFPLIPNKEIIIRNLLKIPVRFKIAHGPENIESRKKFLCSKNELKLLRNIPLKYNASYINSMIANHYFTFENLEIGEPLREKYNSFRNFKCYSFLFSCKIDPYGDVYPCCFLFDDNNSESNIRATYKLGTLMQDSYTITDDPKKLVEVLTNEKMELLRNKDLPIESRACFYCTRHFYQNEFLNCLNNVFEKYQKYDFAENIININEFEHQDSIWI